MSIISIILIAIGLSIDSFTASISSGVCMKNTELKYVVKIAIFMAFFQGLMPLLGWFTGNLFSESIKEFDHWIAFILLLIIGLKMIYDGISSKNEEINKFCPYNTNILLTMSIATSIDALIVGVGFGFLDIDIVMTCSVIAVITFVFSFVGVKIGKKLGERYNDKLQLLGGFVLILLGTKIFIEHSYL